MKISISLPEEDLASLDDFVQRAGLPSRSAAIRRAIGFLRHPDLEREYAGAWEEWESSGDEASWEVASDDGLTRAPR